MAVQQNILSIAEQPLENETIVLNEPIDVQEYNDRIALLKAESELRKVDYVKCAKDKKKSKKVRFTPRLTCNKHGFSNELKFVWIREGIFNEFYADYIQHYVSAFNDDNIANYVYDLGFSTRSYLSLRANYKNILPLFSLPFKRSLDGVGYIKGDKTPIIKFNQQKLYLPICEDWDATYDYVELDHLTRNGHHPEPLGRKMNTCETLECLVDLWASAFRLHSDPYDAFVEMHKWLLDITPKSLTLKSKFVGLDLPTMAYFYAVLYRDGISTRQYTLPSKLYNRRNRPLSRTALGIDYSKMPTKSVLNKIATAREYHDYMGDLHVHRNLVYSIGRQFEDYWLMPKENLRMFKVHDLDKLHWLSSRVYAYRWNIRSKLPQVTNECHDCPNPYCKGDCDFDHTQNFKEKIDQTKQAVFDKIKKTLSNVVPDNISAVFSALKSHFDDLVYVIKGLAEKIKAVLLPIAQMLGLEDMHMDLENTIEIVKYYIVYINTDSSVLRTLCVYQMLNASGLFQILVSTIIDYFDSNTKKPEIDIKSGNETTSFDGMISRIVDIFKGLLSTDPKVIAIPLGLLVFMFFGMRLSGKALSSLGNDFVNSMRNFHFIGAGLLGIGRFMDGLINAIKFIFEWSGKKLFNMQTTEEKDQEAEKKFLAELANWTVQVEELAMEENAPKMAHQTFVQQKVEELYRNGMVYNKMHLEGKMPKMSIPSFIRVWRSCKQMYNIILRAKAVHNFRATPFHIQLYGDPGIGKSTLISVIADRIRLKFYPTNTNHIYAQPQNEQCDGYTGQPIWVIDDASSVNDYKMFIPLLTMISNCPCPLLCSHLEDKGTMFTSDWVLSTTNTPWPTVSGIFCMKALWRRRHLLAKVRTDPDVIDKGTGKFSVELFNQKYPNQDTTSFPHLKFTLMNPVKSGEQLDKMKVLPDGIAEPVTDISFTRFVELMLARAIIQRKEEERFVGDEDAKYKLIREHLIEIDDAYLSFKDKSDVWKRAYEEFFEDGGRKTVPKKKTNEPNPQNFENETEDDFDLDEWIERCQNTIGSEFELKKAFVLDTISAINSVWDEHCEIDVDVLYQLLRMSYELRFFIESDEDTGVVAMLAKDAIINIQRYLWSCKVLGNDNEDHPLCNSETWETCVLPYFEQQLEAEIVIAIAKELKIWIARYKKYGLPSILAFCDKYDNETTATVPESEFRDYHLPSGGLKDLEKELADLRTQDDVAKLRFQTYAEFNMTCDAVLFLLAEWPELQFDNVDKRDVLAKLDTHLLQIPSYVNANANNNEEEPNYMIRESLAHWVVIGMKITVVETEIREFKKREKAYKRKGKRPETATFDPPPPRNGGDWFGDVIVDKRGCRLTSSMRFGVFVTHRFGHGSMWQEIPTDIASPYPSVGHFHLNKKEWVKAFPTVPYSSGNTSISFSFLRTLSRVVENGDKSWWCNPSHVPNCYERVHNYNVFCLHLNKYVVLAMDRKFRRSFDLWMNMSDEERDTIFGFWLKHRFYINIMRSYANKVIAKTKSLFKVIWEKFTGATSYLWQLAKRFKKPVMFVTTAIAIIGACTMFSRLFVPEVTSFRASTIFSKTGSKPGYTSDPIIGKKSLEGVVRCHLEGSRFQGYKIYNQCLLAPYHAVARVFNEKRDFLLTITISKDVQHQFYFNKDHVFRFQEADLVLIYNPNFPSWGDRRKYIKTSEEMEMEKSESAYIVVRNPDDCIEIGETTYGGEEASKTVRFSNSPQITYAKLGVLKCVVNVGTSGAPIYLTCGNKNDSTIAGFQSYRSAGGNSYFTIVSREAIDSIIDLLNDRIVPSNGPFIVTNDAPSDETLALIDNHLSVVGSIPSKYQTFQPGKSEFSVTKFHKILPVTRVPAVLSRFDPRACGDPARHSLNKHGRDSTTTFKSVFLKQAIDDYATYIRDHLGQPHIYTMEEAILGIGSLQHIDLNTSPGIPWIYNRKRPGKKDYIRIDEDGNLEYLDPALKRSVNKFQMLMSCNTLPDFSMQEILKDELRPIGKAYGLTSEQESFYFDSVPYALWPPNRNCKTRTITVLPMEYTIVYRMYFGDMISRLHVLAQKGTFPFAVGINVESTSAANAYFKATSLNNHGFDLDVSNWDGHFGPQCANACIELFNRVYDDQYSTLRKTLMTGAIAGYVQYRDVLYYKDWGLPSGFPGTADMNTLWHMLMAYSIWLELCCENGYFGLMNLSSYFKNSLDLMYGDDRLVVPSEQVENWYNVNTVVEKYTQYGWPATSANKSANIEMQPLDELTFLKRKWCPDLEDPFYVHWAIDKETIQSLLMYIRRTQAPRTQFRDNIGAALDFACDWGRDYYEWLRELINRSLIGTHVPIQSIPYNTMREMKKRRYFGPSLDKDLIKTSVPIECDIEPMEEVWVKVEDEQKWTTSITNEPYHPILHTSVEIKEELEFE